MSRRSPLVLGLSLLVALGAGCGDSSPATEDAGPLPTEQCTNPGDLAIIEALVSMSDAGLPDGGVPDGGPYPYSYERAIDQVIRPCTEEMCVAALLSSDEEGAACVNACLATTPAAGLSEGCVACQLELVPCVTHNCVAVCFGSSDEACDQCILQFCGDRLEACTGIDIPN